MQLQTYSNHFSILAYREVILSPTENMDTLVLHMYFLI